jgi:hypothetical protein
LGINALAFRLYFRLRFFMFAPKDLLGWLIMPFGIAFILWVLLKKVQRESFTCYIGLGVIWAIMAILLDYVFLVKLLKAAGYYKFDVYLYYALTLALPVIVGWRKKFVNKN